jgi:hypothetical protein
MKRQIVRTRRQITIVRIGIPLDPKSEQVDIEALRFLEGTHEERNMT